MTIIRWLLCVVFGHNYVIDREFSTHARRLGCTRCGRMFAMNDDVEVVLPWDEEFEKLYRDIGQWPGRLK